MSPPAMSQRPREYEVTVAEVQLETHDTATLSLDFGPERPEYRAGQFLNLDPHQFRALVTRRWIWLRRGNIS